MSYEGADCIFSSLFKYRFKFGLTVWISKMCFACRKTYPRYGDGEHVCSIAAMLHFGLWWPLDQEGENENSLPDPVQLGVTMPKKTYHLKRVADTYKRDKIQKCQW
jgi:hypothetical protein